ncbi:hypothetical protein [Inhella proteolytica]|uniref:Uncharacterized protein n=1 Tax=Inhella proteolytica TaxID=2795029 RepID=A0A931J6H6_9BURK|nr:hypothetical protein [Inhella proteolytica]MBH9579130.1 hypothetical protein [Inhella proteolytica]
MSAVPPLSRRQGLLALAGLGLSACGGGGGGSAPPPVEPPPPPPPLQLAVSGRAVVKLSSSASRWLGLVERARPLEERSRPERELWVSGQQGQGSPRVLQAEAGRSLLDFALHPSGEFSLLQASDRALFLQRRSASGELLRELAFADPQAASDPFMDDPLQLRDPTALLPHATRDAARLAPLGEDLALAFRSGRQAVVLHRLGWRAAAGFEPQWRRLVEPGVAIGARFVTSGSFDPFKSLDHQWRLLLDSGPQGQLAVALSLDFTELAAGHGSYFGEALDPELRTGALLTQYDADGLRRGTTVLNTQQRSEPHALRWLSGRGQWALAGRVRSQQTAEGWDAYLALLPQAGQGGAGVAQYRVLQLDAGELIFDVAAQPDGRLLVAGVSGYTQNPAGASISEAAQPLLAQLDAEGRLLQRLALPAGPRHNQLRSLSPWQGAWLLGGLADGPGTHSADADPSLLRHDGYVREWRAASA